MENRISRNPSPQVTHSVQSAGDATRRERRDGDQKERKHQRPKDQDASAAVVELSGDAEPLDPPGPRVAGETAAGEAEASDEESAEARLDARGRKLDIRA